MSASPPIDKRQATIHAGLTAVASAICLILASVWGLKQPNLAVWTTFLVMAQHTYSSFQKGIERVVGRGVGIFLGLVLTTWCNDMPLFELVTVGVLLTAFFYVYFAGRLAYTFLQAGLYLVAVLEIGNASPMAVFSEAEDCSRQLSWACLSPTSSTGWQGPSTISVWSWANRRCSPSVPNGSIRA